MSENATTPDIRFVNHGSVVLLFPETEAGAAWVDTNIEFEGWQMIGGGIACEPRSVQDVAQGAANDGLEVEFA